MERIIQRHRSVRTRRLLRIVLTVVAVAAIVAIVWIDVATGLWQETVVLSGVAAGLLTFVLTALVLDRWIAEGEHRRWLPVTRLALIDILHSLADEDRSELSRGKVVPRRLSIEAPADRAAVDRFLGEVDAERRSLTAVVAKWSGFLAGSADVRDLVIHVANVATGLEALRDTVLDAETPAGLDRSGTDRVTAAVAACDSAIQAVVQELRTLLGEQAASE